MDEIYNRLYIIGDGSKFINHFSNNSDTLEMNNIIPIPFLDGINCASEKCRLSDVPSKYLICRDDEVIGVNAYSWYKDNYGSCGDIEETSWIDVNYLEYVTKGNTNINFLLYCSEKYNIEFELHVEEPSESIFSVYKIVFGKYSVIEYSELEYFKFVEKRSNLDIARYLCSWYESIEDIKESISSKDYNLARTSLKLINKTTFNIKSKYR